MAARRHMDFCCLQRTGWKGEGARKLGEYKLFWMLKGNSWGRTAGGRKVDRKGAGSEACERETDGGEGNCREDCAELDLCICAMNSPRAAHPEKLVLAQFSCTLAFPSSLLKTAEIHMFSGSHIQKSLI